MAIDSSLLVGAPAVQPIRPQMGVDYAGQQQKMYSLADSKMNYEDKKQTHDDSAYIQEALKNGADIVTPEGIKNFLEQSKGKLSASGYQHMIDYYNVAGDRERKIQDHYLSMPPKVLESQMAAEDAMAKAAQTSYDQYIKDSETLGIPEAQVRLKANIQKGLGALGQLKNPIDGKPYIPPEQYDQISGMTPGELKAYIDQSTYGRKLAAAAVENRLKTAHAKVYENAANKPQGVAGELAALDDALESGTITQAEYDAGLLKIKGAAGRPVGGAGGAGGAGAAALTPEEEKALFGPEGAVTTGKIDYRRVNSRTAKMLAHAAMINPNSDLEAISADVNMIRNPTYRQKMANAEVLPEVMRNMVEAGKKVDLSKVKIIGQLEAWTNGQLNDPDWIEYLTQRNDALMMIAATMRGVGMTDQAHRAEIEAASPTMDGKALDAWYEGQMKSLAPRLKQYRGVAERKGAVNPAPGMQTPPDVQAGRDTEARDIQAREMTTEKAALDAATKSGDKEGAALHQRNIAELERELSATSPKQQRKAAAAAPPNAPAQTGGLPPKEQRIPGQTKYKGYTWGADGTWHKDE